MAEKFLRPLRACPCDTVEIQGPDPKNGCFNKHRGEIWLGAEWVTVEKARELRRWLDEVIP